MRVVLGNILVRRQSANKLEKFLADRVQYKLSEFRTETKLKSKIEVVISVFV